MFWAKHYVRDCDASDHSALGEMSRSRSNSRCGPGFSGLLRRSLLPATSTDGRGIDGCF
jgi:hypothetical protein